MLLKLNCFSREENQNIMIYTNPSKITGSTCTNKRREYIRTFTK